MGRKIRRSNHNKIIAGVCGGLAEYFDIDVTLIRLGFVFATFFGGLGSLLYIALLFIMPDKESYVPNNFFDDDEKNVYSDPDKDFTHVMGDSMDFGNSNSNKSSTFLGVCLILFGLMLLFKQFLPKINFIELFPIILVFIGLAIVYKNGRKQV